MWSGLFTEIRTVRLGKGDSLVRRTIRQANAIRNALANKSLFIVLGVTAILAVGFWAYQFSTVEKAPKTTFAPTEPTPLYCEKCGKVTIVDPGTFATIRRAPVTGRYECPACKALEAKIGYGPPGRTVPETPAAP